MTYDAFIHHRRSTRLRGYDYSHPGMYFVTIVAEDRQCRFGRIVNHAMEYSELGVIADVYWKEIPQHHVGIELDEYIIMPNHVHGIVILKKQLTDVSDGCVQGEEIHTRGFDDRISLGGGVQLNAPTGDPNSLDTPITIATAWNIHPDRSFSPPRGSLSVVIRTFKAAVTTWARRNGHWDFAWQRGFHDHIIQDGSKLSRIRKYIQNNPRYWTRSH